MSCDLEEPDYRSLGIKNGNESGEKHRQAAALSSSERLVCGGLRCVRHGAHPTRSAALTGYPLPRYGPPASASGKRPAQWAVLWSSRTTRAFETADFSAEEAIGPRNVRTSRGRLIDRMTVVEVERMYGGVHLVEVLHSSIDVTTDVQA